MKKKMISAADADAVAEFENLLREKRLLIAWYNYRDDVYSEFAKRWCEANGLELVR